VLTGGVTAVLLGTFVLAGGVVSSPPPPLRTTEIIACAGTETVKAPPESVDAVSATECELSVRYAVADVTDSPDTEILTLCAEPPVFVKMTATLPSVFLNAAMATEDTLPVVATR
jgi:hypothetical protein